MPSGYYSEAPLYKIKMKWIDRPCSRTRRGAPSRRQSEGESTDRSIKGRGAGGEVNTIFL